MTEDNVPATHNRPWTLARVLAAVVLLEDAFFAIRYPFSSAFRKYFFGYASLTIATWQPTVLMSFCLFWLASIVSAGPALFRPSPQRSSISFVVLLLIQAIALWATHRWLTFFSSGANISSEAAPTWF